MRLIYAEIFERMLEAAHLQNSSQLAKALGVTPQALSNYKKRGEIPTSLLFKFAAIYDVSVDWLISGSGTAFKCLEESAAYGTEYGSFMDFSGLSSDEIISVGKLLKVLRRADKRMVLALKASIDAFLGAVKDEGNES